MSAATAHPRLNKAPVILVLAQIRFTPFLKMAEHIVELQDALRKQGFPLFEEEQAVLIGPGVSSAAPRPRLRWIFTNADRTESIVLTENFVVLETNDYDIFASFLKKFEGVIELLKSKVDIDSTERVGLRYVNLVRPTNDRTSVQLVSKELRGVDGGAMPGVEGVQNTLISQGKTRFGNIVVKAIQSSAGNFLPDDLASSKLDFEIELEKGELITLLDIDHYGLIRKEFDEAEVNPVLDEMHDIIDDVFRFSVTEEAISLWA